MDDISQMTKSEYSILEGAISGRALYDGRINANEALALLRAGKRGEICLNSGLFLVLMLPVAGWSKGLILVDLVDAGDPVEAAIAYDAAGADELCFLDITASSDGREATFDMIERHRRTLFYAANGWWRGSRTC